MTVRTVRIEIDGGPRRGGAVVYVDPPELTVAERAAVNAALDRLLGEVQELIDAADWTGAPFGVPSARELLLVVLVEQAADEAAYRREAARRGVLAL